jgi:membrane protein required for colicin V production
MTRVITVNWIDWITLAIVLISILRGTRYGVLAGIIDLVAMLGAFFAASILYVQAVPTLQHSLYLPPDWGGFLAFTVIWLALYLSVGIAVRLVHGIKTVPLSEILGGAMGVVRGLALMTACLVIALASPFHKTIEQDTKRSIVAPLLLKGHDAVMVTVVPSIPVRIPRIGPGGNVF